MIPPAAVMLLLLMLIPPRIAEAAVYGDVSVSMSSPERAQTTHGYAEYRATVSNRSPAHTSRVVLLMSGYRGGGMTLESMRRVVDVQPGATVHVSLLQPALPLAAYQVRVAIDGEWQRNALSLSPSGHGQTFGGWRSPYAAPAVLVSRGVTGDVRDQINREVVHVVNSGKSTHVGYGSGSMTMPATEFAVRAESQAARWSTNWLAYTRWDGIVITAGELSSMAAPVRDALRQYVTAGGSLLVLGDYEPPPRWRTPTDHPVAGDKSIAEHHIGFGCVLSVNETDAGPGAADWSERLDGWTDQHWETLYEVWQRSGSPWQGAISRQEANRRFPVVEDLGIPARGMLLLMVIFAVAIGPLNLVVLGRMNRRIWLLWTTPAIALVFCGAVFGYALVAEGWTARGRTTQFTLLNQQTHRATTLGWVAFYSPLTPGGGAHFSRDTELTPLVQSDPWTREGSAVSLDWSVDQHLTSGWITARVPAHFKVRKSETRRERLAVSRDSTGELVAVNGLGATVERLRLADEQGKVYVAQAIAPGAKVTLSSVDQAPAVQGPDLGQLYRDQWLQAGATARNMAGVHLAPLSYVATLDQAIFVEPGIESVDGQREAAVVLGLLEEIAVGN